MAKLKPCPFCGGEADLKGWAGPDGIRGPECKGCGATACSVASWELRVEVVLAPDPDLPLIPLGVNPRQIFDFYVTNPNLFRTLAQRLSEFAIYIKVSYKLLDQPMEEGSIGPDVVMASALLIALADEVEEASDDV